MTFHSVLVRTPKESAYIESQEAPDSFRDLNLDQVVETITADWQEYRLAPFYHAPLHNLDAIAYRQEVMRDLQDGPTMQAIRAFSEAMRSMREGLAQAETFHYYEHTQQRCFLRAVEIYCAAVESLFADLSAHFLVSYALTALRQYLGEYIASPAFRQLIAEAAQLTADLAAIRYSVLLREGSVTVRRTDTEIDYSAAVEAIFEKFRRGVATSYWLDKQKWKGMNHVEAQIQQRVALLFPEAFARLPSFFAAHAEYADRTLLRFDREVQFYVSYLTYVQKLRGRGLAFSQPVLSQSSKEIRASKVFDIALAGKLLDTKTNVVTNDFFLKGHERIFVVSGANQGGKTTFARTFGQMHYLAALGCPVPGEDAHLFLFDRLFTHFERKEDIRNLRGKLQDDLVRIHHILDNASPQSLIVMNEIFASTTLLDALYLGMKILAKISALDVLAVCVTFLDELASFNEKTVSVVSIVDPANPAIRTYKLERKPADGLAYAMAIAQKYRVTYDSLKERIPS